MWENEKSYSKIQKTLTVTFFVLVLVPVIIVFLVSAHNLKNCAIYKTEALASKLLDHRKDVINLFLKKQEDLLATLTGIYSLEYLEEVGHLQELFLAVNKTNEIVDLHVIDSSGKQLAYVGPYWSSIEGKNYRVQPWFKEALVSGRHVSDVFTGFRGVPHFVIAVTDPLKTYVLRATINSEIFNALLHSAQIGPNGDAYIVNRQAAFQTPSLQGTKILSAEEKNILEYHEGTYFQTIDGYRYCTRWVRGGQWLLVIKSRIEDSLGDYYEIRNTNLMIIAMTCLLVMLLAAFVSWHLVRRLERADRDKHELDQHLIQMEKMATVGRLAAGIAHEINNPLQMITNQAGWMDELLVEENPSQMKNLTEYKESINKIKYHVKRAATVTHRLLGFSRKIIAEKQCVQVNELIEETLSFVENDAKNNNIRIEKKFCEELPTTMSDGPQLQQVFLNLLGNGLDAIDKDGTLEVSTRVAADNIYIEFADTGTGIKPELMKKIFDPFFTTKDPGKGTGLGMAISYNIMRKLGGKIDVRNREEGGAVFTLTLPIVKLGD
ncbi:MAG: two-component sensor histidine kinase [Proteobacteria bacterium]|nr:two-component sensor histidine kinase [Pseudomonadota bacterium]MBU1059183.1 two-component sensor histidine kinase [Pseudomonadota bacterium]